MMILPGAGAGPDVFMFAARAVAVAPQRRMAGEMSQAQSHKIVLAVLNFSSLHYTSALAEFGLSLP